MSSEVPRVPPPGGPKEGVGGKKDSEASPDKFKKLMVEKVDETAADQKKNKKQRGQGLTEEEEEALAAEQVPATPPPFSLDLAKKAGPSPLEIQTPSVSPAAKTAAQVSPGPAATPPPTSPPPSSPPPPPPSPEATTPPPSSLPPAPLPEAVSEGIEAPTLPPIEQPSTEQQQQQQQQQAAPSPAKPDEQQKESTPSILPPAVKGAKAEKGATKEQKLPSATTKGMPGSLGTQAAPKEEREALFKQLGKGEEGQAIPVNKEIEEEVEQAEGLAPASPPPGTTPPSGKKEEAKTGDILSSSAELGGVALTPQQEIPGTTPVSPPPYTFLEPQVLDLYARMVGTMTVMVNAPGDQRVTIDLSGEKFATSIFFGGQIIINEYSTARGTFNIELRVPNSAAAALAEKGTADLMAAFQHGVQQGQYKFRVNEFKTSLKTDIVTRKEDVSKEKK